MVVTRRVCRFAEKNPSLIELERHRRTDSHSSRSDGRSGRGRASRSVGPTSEVRLQSEDRGARWPIYCERSTSNVLVSLDTWTHWNTIPLRWRLHEQVVRGDAIREHLVRRVFISTGRPGRMTIASPSSREVLKSSDPNTATSSTAMGWRPRIGAHRARQAWPSVFRRSNDRATKIQVSLLLIYRQ